MCLQSPSPKLGDLGIEAKRIHYEWVKFSSEGQLWYQDAENDHIFQKQC